jgi:serine/threonine protein kinase
LRANPKICRKFKNPAASDVTRPLHDAHQNADVHRILKPSNILVDANRAVTLLDSGIAKLLNARWPSCVIGPGSFSGFHFRTSDIAGAKVGRQAGADATFLIDCATLSPSRRVWTAIRRRT